MRMPYFLPRVIPPQEFGTCDIRRPPEPPDTMELSGKQCGEASSCGKRGFPAIVSIRSAKDSLCDCLGIDACSKVVALVGAGGKTTLMYALAAEMLSRGSQVITTTTTKIFPPGPDQSPRLILLSEDRQLKTLPAALEQYGHVTVARSLIPATGKLDGVPGATVELCSSLAHFVLVEADGAAGRPIKAPERWEPVIPAVTRLVIVVAGLDCIGEPATERSVFRLARFTAITGIQRGQTITPLALADLLGHPLGGLKGVPPEASVVAFLNKKDLLKEGYTGTEIAEFAAERAGGRVARVVVGSLIQLR